MVEAFSRGRETIEAKLTPEELEKIKLSKIQHSREFRDHVKFHEEMRREGSNIGAPVLHVATEPIFQEKRQTGREQSTQPREETDRTAEAVTYASRDQPGGTGGTYTPHTSEAHSYAGANVGDRPGLWATCNCGVQFKLDEKKDGTSVTTYNPTTLASGAQSAYGTSSSSTTYTTETSATSYSTSQSKATYA